MIENRKAYEERKVEEEARYKELRKNSNCEYLFGGNEVECEKLYDCCDCGIEEEDKGCGSPDCWSCNACDTCLND